MTCHSARPLRLGFLAAPLAVILAACWGPPALAAAGRPAATGLLTSCSFTALQSAVAAGGTVDYGTSCQSTPVTFTSTIFVPAGLTVDVEANGHSVTFSGAFKVRLFEVTGGKLTIGHITMSEAQVSAAGGTTGGNGGAGTTGSSGATGANGPTAPRRARTAPRPRPAAMAVRRRRARRAAPAGPARSPRARPC